MISTSANRAATLVEGSASFQVEWLFVLIAFSTLVTDTPHWGAVDHLLEYLFGLSRGEAKTLVLLLAALPVLPWALSVWLTVPALRPIAMAWAAFGLWGLASCAWSIAPAASFGAWCQEVLVAALMLPLGVMSAAKVRSFDRFGTGLVVLIALVAVFVVAEGLQPNEYGFFDGVVTPSWLILLLPLLMYWMASEDSPVSQWCAFGLALVLFSFALTFSSRAFWLAGIIGVPAFACGLRYGRVPLPRQKSWLVLSAMLFALCVCGFVLAAWVKPATWLPGGSGGDGYLWAMVSRSERLLVSFPFWIEQATKNIWTGVGLGWDNPRNAYLMFAPPGYPSVFFWHGHNLFLNILLQLGVVGVGLFLLLLGSVFLVARRRFVEGNHRQQVAAMVVMTTLLVLVVRNFPDDGFREGNTVFFWLIMGFGLGLAGIDIRSPARELSSTVANGGAK